MYLQIGWKRRHRKARVPFLELLGLPWEKFPLYCAQVQARHELG